VNGQPRSLAIDHGGVFLAGELAEPLWRFLQAAIRQHERDGAHVRSEIREALDALRVCALREINVRTNGHLSRTLADIERASESQAITTASLAGLLGVGDRQARRIALAAGVVPIQRGRWRRADALALADGRDRKRRSA
jgi:hypothetical protein